MKLFIPTAVLVLMVLAGGASAQNDAKTDWHDAQVLSLPIPEFPDIAKDAGLSGKVTVLVAIDEHGNVTSAQEALGPDWVCPAVMRPDVVALRDAAKAASLNAKFSPAMQNGKAVASTLRVNYQFGKPSTNEDEPVTYTAAATLVSTPSPVKGDPVTPVTAGKAPEPNYVGTSGPPPNARNTNTGLPAKDTDKVSAWGDPVRPSAVPTTIIAGESRPKTISGGVLNGRAIKLPKPSYPAAARAVRASGAVSIQVLIDTDGTVFSAQAVSGHPLLQSASRNAACNSQFTQILLSGEPFRVSGIIVYNFVP